MSSGSESHVQSAATNTRHAVTATLVTDTAEG
jgi:hypothetical protein